MKPLVLAGLLAISAVTAPGATEGDAPPTGVVAGRVAVPRNAVRPREVEVRFAPTPGPPSPAAIYKRKGPAGPEDLIACPVADDGRLQCEIPAGRHDLRLHAKGFAAVYRWGVEVTAGQPFDLGTVDLVPGASVVGFVERFDRAPLDRTARIELRPVVGGSPSADQDRSLASMSLSTTPNDRGFFQLRDVAPGGWALTATVDGLAPARLQPVEVLEGLETRLPHPLALEPPAVLDLAIHPPVGPYDIPWRLRLAREISRGVLRDVESAQLGPDGRWRVVGLSSGRYRLAVESGSTPRWGSYEIEVEPGMAPVTLEIPLVEVEGVLRGLAEPQRAEVWFGGLDGARRVGFFVDEDGRFDGVLPGEGEWPVTVLPRRGAEPRSVAPVEVRRAPGQRVAHVELELPRSRLAGRVVDDEGDEVAGARVKAHSVGSPHGREGAISDERGGFAFEGLAAGRYWVLAESGSAVSDATLADVAEDREPSELRLVVREQTEVEGLVVSARDPVPGAAVVMTPDLRSDPGTHGVAAVHRLTTDLVGRFRAAVPPWTIRVGLLVLPPGFAARILSLPVEAGRTMEIAVEPLGGTLVLDLSGLPALATRSGGERLFPMLAHGGAEVFLDQLRRWADLHGTAQPDAGTWVLPMMEPGGYALCVTLPRSTEPGRERDAQALCADGQLAPGGELALALPAG